MTTFPKFELALLEWFTPSELTALCPQMALLYWLRFSPDEAAPLLREQLVTTCHLIPSLSDTGR